MNKNKKYMIVFGIFALVIVTTAASFAFFTYSRVGTTTTTITSGDIEFTYKEGEDASLANAFPVSDSVGANDTSEEYTFTVNLKSSSTSNKMNYNVYLLDNNKGTDNYFTNDQIKFALTKDGTFVAGTSGTEGKKLTDISGFTEGEHTGEGIVLENQEIVSGKTDEYKLRIWISDDVDYSNTDKIDDGTNSDNDAETSIGKYNGYKYSLRVKVGSEIANSIVISNLKYTVSKITADISDPNGLSYYAVTNSSTVPADGSSEWIEITNDTVKGTVTKVADSLITSKTLTHKISGAGTYYLHIKNKLNQTKSISVVVKKTDQTATDFIMNLAEENQNQIRIDAHEPTGQQTFATTEYRYWGATPNNYVWFNEELWRIIGLFDVDDGKGIIEKRLKIVRNDSIGSYSWDSSANGINDGYGINEWKQADLMELLNSGAYYNRITGNCYNGKYNSTVPCDFTKIGLTSDAKEMISDAKWYLGAHNSDNVGVIDFYKYERGNVSGKQCSSKYVYCTDKVSRTLFWVGKVGLIYPSDYGYSTNINTCSSTLLSNYNSGCMDTSWLFKKNYSRWTLTPSHNIYSAPDAFSIEDSGYLEIITGSTSKEVYPTVYLLEDIKIVDGLGTDQQPYILSK